MNLRIARSAMAGMILVACFSVSSAFAQGIKAGEAAQAESAGNKPAAKPGVTANTVGAAPMPQVFATVNGKAITQAEFHSAYATFLRQKFYHGQVPQDKLEEARKEVGDKLIDRILFLEEIQRRGIVADTAEVDRQIQVYEQRYAASPNWQKNREAMLPGLRQQLVQQSGLTRLEQAVRDVPPPHRDEVKAFYAAKPELFTEPEKIRLHTILLAVPPSSEHQVWDAALREAEAMVKRIRGGADFSELARLSSQDESADKGGDMGYLHRGMLPEPLHVKIDSLKVGEVSEPIQLLQGVGIFRLDERIPAKLQDFGSVADRAADLLLRERKEKAWQDFVAKLRGAATIVIHESPALSSGAK